MDTESLTYRELAQRLGVKVESVRKQAQRRRWQKVTGNDGLVRILVPLEFLSRPVDSPPDSPVDGPAIYTRELETRIEGMHQLLAAETRRADTAEAQGDHWRRQAELLARRRWFWRRAG